MIMEILRRSMAFTADATTCALLNLAQWRHRHDAVTKEILEQYLTACEPLHRSQFYAAPELEPLEETPQLLRWPSPHPSGLPVNDQASALLLPCSTGWCAPTVFLLHALMSVNDIGYRRLASQFHALGWNAVFLHLPYHYERRVPRYLNGELAMTADLVRNGEALRQGVSEARQLMAWLRVRGCREFGIFGTSYGAWTGALLASLETDISFLALLQPIADVEHAIWKSPAGITIRHLLKKNGIHTGMTQRHQHLTSPLHALPHTERQRVILAIGAYDRIAPPDRVNALASAWGGARVMMSPQGHFGYIAAREMFAAVKTLLT